MYTYMFMYVCMYMCVQPYTKAMVITFIFKNIYLPSHVLSIYLFMHPYDSKGKLFWNLLVEMTVETHQFTMP